MTNDASDRTAQEQQVAACSQHSGQVAVELAEATIKAMQYQEESSTLLREMEALQNKVETAGQEKQDRETQRTKALEQRQSPTTVSSWTTRETDEDTGGYVVPPVDIPTRYRTRDLQGGNEVGGNYVIFTYWAFKRRQQRMHHLRPILERTDAGDQELRSEIKEATPEVVSKPAGVPVQTQQRFGRKRASEEISDSEDRLRLLRRKLNTCLANAAARARLETS
ncbi:hypothetical protein PRIC1_012828 [Phytophthora ramorum]